MVNFDLIKVSAVSSVNKVAGAIAMSLKEKSYIEVRAIGPHAVNQAVKAIAVARGHLAPNNTDLSCIPSFEQIDVEDNQKRTAMKFKIKLEGEL